MSFEDVDSVKRVSSKQAEWKALSVDHKIEILQEISHILSALNMDQMVQLLGIPEAAMMGFDMADNPTEEGYMEACQACLIYAVTVQACVSKLLLAYQCAAGNQQPPKLKSVKNASGRVTVQTIPVLSQDKFGPQANSTAEVWLKPSQGADFVEGDAFDLDCDKNDATGARVVLAAGNHCFLATVDCLHGLFHCHQTVFLKHHPVRNHHDILLRKIMKPLIDRGYFDTELDMGNLQRSKDIVYHEAVTHVHLTGGCSTHDAIVWGTTQRDVPLLKAEMTSELGCVTPWIVAPQAWTDAQMDHQVKQLFTSLYSNAGANCNSPKVVILPKTWPHRQEFVDKLCQEMKRNPLPVAYYPGSKERWTAFQKVYPDAVELGDDSIQTNSQRGLKGSATVLPWLLMDGVQVDLSTEKGRKAARTEYAFRHEPFAPVVTIAYADDMPAAVQLANDYLFGSLSCTILAPITTSDVEQAIADLKYGAIAVNVWSALCYLATGCTWGAFPGERIEAVETGIGQIHNCFFIPDIEKSVLRTPMVDASHPLRKSSDAAATKEFTAICNFVLQPGIAHFLNLMTVTLLGVELKLPKASILIGIAAVAVGVATRKLWM